MEGIDGLRVVVTGSSRGIGRAAAVRLGALGARVVINGTQASALAETAAALEAVGAEYRMVTGSVAEPATAQALIDSAVIITSIPNIITLFNLFPSVENMRTYSSY